MAFQQLISPNTGVKCVPGWCLTYVQNAFGVGWAGYTATDGWGRALFKHADDKFPNVAVPVWFAMKGEPAGHVAIRMADGSYYSTSHPTNTTAYHHPNLQDLLNYYGGRLTLRGWSEDLNSVRLIINNEERIMTPEEVDLLWQVAFNQQADADTVKTFAGQPVKAVLQHALKFNLPQRTEYSEFRNVAAALAKSDEQVNKLRRQLADNPTDLELIDAPVYKKIK